MPFIQTSGTTKVSKHVQMTETQDKVVRSCKVICSFGCGVLAGLVVLWQVHPQPCLILPQRNQFTSGMEEVKKLDFGCQSSPFAPGNTAGDVFVGPRGDGAERQGDGLHAESTGCPGCPGCTARTQSIFTGAPDGTRGLTNGLCCPCL